MTSSLSGTRSNQLSYKPLVFRKGDGTRFTNESLPRRFNFAYSGGRRCACFARRLHALCARLHPFRLLLRKEVIQPLVPQRLPCYDFIPITTHTLGRRMPDFGCRRLS